MTNKTKTAGKTATECVGVTETQKRLCAVLSIKELRAMLKQAIKFNKKLDNEAHIKSGIATKVFYFEQGRWYPEQLHLKLEAQHD